MNLEVKIECKNNDGFEFLSVESWNDHYLMRLNDYLFEHRNRIPRVLGLLSDPNETEYGGNLIYMYMQGSVVFIYDSTYNRDEQVEFGIGINRADLIKIMKAWLEVNELGVVRGGIKEMVLQRDEEHINMIVHYEDGSEFKRTFNYKCNEEELKALKDYYFEE